MLSFEIEPERQETVAAYWRRHHTWLASKGYMLRASLRASWTPSGDLDLDPRYLQRGVVIDATRASDGMHVALKRVCLDRASAEVDLAHYFHALNGKSLRNHCTPILDIFPVDGEEKDVILVMPLLKSFDEPPFRTFGEVVAFLSQIFEGLEFLHDTVNITHGECVSRHIMMDASPLYEHPYDPSFPALRRDWSGPSKPRSRTSRPVRYYFVDFGHAKSTLAKADTAEVQEIRAADIYELGNTIRKVFFNQYDGFEFLYPVLADMMQVNPSDRPTARTLFRRFLNVRDSLSESKLRARLIHRNGEPLLKRLGNDVSHWLVTAKRSLVGVPAIPDA